MSVHIYTEPQDKGAFSVPIGKPIQNTKLFVLDSFYNLLPPGIVGELFLSGEQLARGYLGRTDLTSERYGHIFFYYLTFKDLFQIHSGLAVFLACMPPAIQRVINQTVVSSTLEEEIIK